MKEYERDYRGVFDDIDKLREASKKITDMLDEAGYIPDARGIHILWPKKEGNGSVVGYIEVILEDSRFVLNVTVYTPIPKGKNLANLLENLEI